MTDNSQNFDNLQERNKQVLDNISQLQSQEKQLYDSLDDVTISSDQKQQIINKINEQIIFCCNPYQTLTFLRVIYHRQLNWQISSIICKITF